MAINRNSDTLVIKRWYSGLHTQRNPLLTPVSVQGMHVIERYDTLIDGLNVEFSNKNTLERRPGYSVQCAQSVTDPNGFYSFKNIAGTIKLLADTATKVQTFTPSVVTDLFTKGIGAGQTRFQSIANFLYMANGVDSKKWDGNALTNWGIVAPAVAPVLTVNASQGPPPQTTIGPIISAIPAQQTPSSGAAPTWELNSNIWRYVTSAGTQAPLAISFTIPVLPTGTVITGMKVSFGATSQNPNPNQNALNSLGWWNGAAIVGTPKSDATVWPTLQWKQFTYGGNNDLWGMSATAVLTQAQTGTISFGLQGTNPNFRGFTNNFQLTLYTSTPVGWQPGTNFALGTVVFDGTNSQVITGAGVSGITTPIWNAVVGGTTGDGSVTWTNLGAVVASGASAPASLSPQFGYRYVSCYRNSTSGGVSSASPLSLSTGPQSNATFTLTGSGSTDTQVDQVQIYRTADGGATYFLLATLANATNWTYTDATPDALLNTQLVAPLNHVNDPPPSGTNNIAFHAGRLFVSSGNFVYFAGGPDVTNGSPQEAFSPSNVFTFPGLVTAMASTSAGLLVFTASDTYIIRGLNSRSFYSQPFLQNFGCLSQNAIAKDGDTLFVFTTQQQLFMLSDTTMEETGFDIGDKLMLMQPGSVYLSLHRSGVDGGLFVSDGSTNVHRYNLAKSCWSPAAQPVGGARCIGSVQTSVGVQRLLLGQSGTHSILYRDLTNWQDNTATYGAFATVGSLVLAAIGSTSLIETILLEFAAGGQDPDVLLLLNEVNGTFVSLQKPVNEPPMLPPSLSVSARRYWLKAAQTPLPQQIHHLQVKVQFAPENKHNELLTLGLMPPQK